MTEDQTETTRVKLPKKLEFINKEFSENKITTKFLNDLLVKEEKRKAILESRAYELNKVTKVKIHENVQELSKSVNASLKQTVSLRSELVKSIQGKLPNRCDDPEIYVKLDDIDYLEKSRDYVLVIHFVMLVSSKLSTQLRDKNYAEAIAMFNQLRSLRDVILVKSDASNLYKYCSGVVDTWEIDLDEKVANELVTWLEKVGWPSRIDTANPTDDTLKKFQNTIRCFSSLTKGSTKPQTEPNPVILSDYRELSALVQLIMKPIGKRFRYHFYSSKATSDVTKPEWYFAQVKQWMRELVPFLFNYVEAIHHEMSGTSAIFDFVLALSQLLVLKTDAVLMSSTAPVDDVIFSKILEESSRFESDTKVLLDSYNLRDTEELPGFVSTIFSQPVILNRWLSIEKRGSLEKMDILFSSGSAWNRIVIPGPTEIAELFVMILRFMVDRFSHLRQPGQKIQFVQLIIEILDDFRIRCLQVWKSEAKVDNLEFLVAETLGYVHEILQEWEESPFFSTLDFFWGTIRSVEKEDLEARGSSSRRLSDLTSGSDDEPSSSDKGLFSQVRERYASSMEMLLISISQK